VTFATEARIRADDAVRQVLLTQYDGVPAVRLDSPPGAGKTGVVERLAVQGMAHLAERCMVVTQTNQQAFDLARRCARGFPGMNFVLLVRRDLTIHEDLTVLPNLTVIRNSADLQPGPCVVIANARRWSWSAAGVHEGFDCMIVDEAFQLSDHHFHEIANVAERVVLVGDPGQIAPVVNAQLERWRTDPAGPHVPCSDALLARHPDDVLILQLPVSRRLVPDTVEVVQPAFYPDLPFGALTAPGERRIVSTAAGKMPLDAPIDLAARGASLVVVELPARVTGEADPELAGAMVGLVDRLFERGTIVVEGGEEQPLEPGMVGIVCAHVSQVHSVQERLGSGMDDVLVETADRFQGLERHVMLAHHPLSGRADADEFHLDAGRLCVMMSRHSVTCFIFARAGMEGMLLRHAPSGDRVLGSDEDEEFEGWNAHLSVLRALRERGRVVRR
jgi:hypothetical protein